MLARYDGKFGAICKKCKELAEKSVHEKAARRETNREARMEKAKNEQINEIIQ